MPYWTDSRTNMNDKVEQNQFDILIQGGCFFIEDDW